MQSINIAGGIENTDCIWLLANSCRKVNGLANSHTKCFHIHVKADSVKVMIP